MTDAAVAVNLHAGDRLRKQPLHFELSFGGAGNGRSKVENRFPYWRKSLDAWTDEHESRASKDAVRQKEIAETVGMESRDSPPLHNRHSNVLPALVCAKCAREIVEHNKCYGSREFDSAPRYYGLPLFQIGNFATVAGVA